MPGSDDEAGTQKTIVRRTPRMENIPTIILDTDGSDQEQDTKRKPATKSPAEIVVNAALGKLGIGEDKTPQWRKKVSMEDEKTQRQKRKNMRISSTPLRINPYAKHQMELKSPIRYKYIGELLNGQKKLTIAVEGNIAIGKTTFLNKLRELAPVQITTIKEPLKQWTENANVNLLDRTYKNPHKWSFILQSLIMTNMLQNHITSGQTKIMERSLGSSYHIFLQLHHINETMDKMAITSLQDWYHTAEDLYMVKPDLIIYLRATPDLAMERLKKRNRKEEKSIPYKYLAQIHSLYDKWLFNEDAGVKVIPINANQSTEAMLRDLNIQVAHFNLKSKF